MTNSAGTSDFDARLAADPVHNELEQSMLDGIRGEVRQTVFISAFLTTPVYALSRTEASADASQGFSPLVLSTTDGAPMLPLFTDLGRVPAEYLEVAPHAVTLTGGRFVASVADEVGIVVNPGHPIGFELSPGALAAIRRDFAESQQG
ncbi:SseB family protein [Agreia sp. Leaf283]|uniref:SseB family protein n=1 Tax=Agreia sp. Leaf283 TaxID=1736321 RepID=UPI0006F98156|nr:SseB family protein [Agreia sp. Leaf283]KQP56700.1 hypothetical protein ASF51_01925 [Agreia sp. Leaf283]